MPTVVMIPQAAASADVLGEKILDELLEDTAQELLSLDSRAKVRSEALTMQDGPTLEIMLQRMEEMEVTIFHLVCLFGSYSLDSTSP